MPEEESTETDIICLSNWHATGGAQLNAGMLTAEFLRRGYRADLVFLFERDPHSRHGTDSFHVIAPRPPRSASELRAFLTGFKTRIISSTPRAIFGFQPAANILGALASARVKGCQMVATQRNPSDRQSARTTRLERLCGSSSLYTANIAVTQTVADSFINYPDSYRSKLQVIHNATPPLVDVGDTTEACRVHFGMAEDRLILGCLGRLHPQKNIPFALEVVADLPEACLYLAGGGPEQALLEMRAEELGVTDRVFFIGPVAGGDITRFYRSLDVLLFPSLYEGFGRVLTEAMSQGVVIVANDLPVVREVGGQALLTRPLDVSAWVEAVRLAGTDNALIDRLANRGRERASIFSMQTMADGYLAAAGLPPQVGKGRLG